MMGHARACFKDFFFTGAPGGVRHRFPRALRKGRKWPALILIRDQQKNFTFPISSYIRNKFDDGSEVTVPPAELILTRADFIA